MQSHRDDALAVGVPDAARRAGVSRSFLYEEMTAGRLRFLKAGKRRLILADDLRAWLSSLRDAKPSAKGA
jgi:excisionase family DNA binding protein